MRGEALNMKTETSEIEQTKMSKTYDLEARTLTFARDVRKFTASLPNSIANREDIKQIVRSSGSVGANYLEANESLSRKDFIMRIKISKKETRETIFWFDLLSVPSEITDEHQRLRGEATEIIKILGAILRNSQL